jgi:hypothetical protein
LKSVISVAILSADAAPHKSHCRDGNRRSQAFFVRRSMMGSAGPANLSNGLEIKDL